MPKSNCRADDATEVYANAATALDDRCRSSTAVCLPNQRHKWPTAAATVANPFADIIQTAQKAPRPRRRCGRRTPARCGQETGEDAGAVADPGDKRASEQLRQGGGPVKRETTNGAAKCEAAAPQPAQDEAPPPPPPAPRDGAALQRVDDALFVDSRLPAARRASFALVQPTSKPPPLIEEATPSLRVGVYGAFGKGEGAAGSSSSKGAYAARPRELFGRGDLAVNRARRCRVLLPGRACLCGNQPVGRCRRDN